MPERPDASEMTERMADTASAAIGQGLFTGLLMSIAVLLLARQADILAFEIPLGLLAAIAVVALLVGSAMDTSVTPE